MIKSGRAFITGAEGFVGPYLAKELLGRGYVVEGTYLKVPSHLMPKEVRQVQVDILDKEGIRAALKGFKPTVVFHLAGISDVKFSLANPALTMKINVQGTTEVLEAAMILKERPRVVVIGSAEEYGIPRTVPMSEDHPLNPVSPYGKSKLEAENESMRFADKGLHVIVTRSFNHIGPGQTENFVTSAFAKQIADIERGLADSMSVGNLSSKRDFMDVRDTVKAYALLAEKGTSGEVYNVCSGKAYEIKEILDILKSQSRKDFAIWQDPARMRPSDIPILLGDSSKISKATGWKASIPLSESLRDVLDYWRSKDA